MEMTRTKLGEGVYLTYLPGGKFKTGLLSAQFVTPLERDTASAGALLPAVLRRGTRIWAVSRPGWMLSTAPGSTIRFGKRGRISAWALWPA